MAARHLGRWQGFTEMAPLPVPRPGQGVKKESIVAILDAAGYTAALDIVDRPGFRAGERLRMKQREFVSNEDGRIEGKRRRTTDPKATTLTDTYAQTSIALGSGGELCVSTSPSLTHVPPLCDPGEDEREAKPSLSLAYLQAQALWWEGKEHQAAELYHLAAELGHAGAKGCCHQEGWGRYSTDEVEAVRLFKEASAAGDVFAMLNLGNCYEEGKGVDADMARAAEWYTRAAELGYAKAMIFLGVCYSEGSGVKEDKARAVEWYMRAAGKGDSEAMQHLGDCYLTASGVEEDKALAVEWYTRAADGGESEAMLNLGVCYDEGEGVEKDKARAFAWYSRAAEKGESKAMYCVGVCYDVGEGVEENKALAAEWFNRAAEKGDPEARQLLGISQDMDHVEEDEAHPPPH